MNNLMLPALLGLALLGAGSSAQVKAPDQPTAAQAAERIAQVKKVLVSKLDDGLPKTALETWLQAQVGPDAKIEWVFRSNCTSDSPQKPRDCVEADVPLSGGHSLVVMISVDKSSGQHPSVYSLNLLEGKQGVRDATRLRDLPKLLGDAGLKLNDFEAA